jgi:endoglucanase
MSISIKKLITILCAVCAASAFGQTANYPFPQHVVYPNGHMPVNTALTDAKAQSWYNSWKTERLKPCPGKGLMATADDDNQVKVEGMGWAMIASAYMGDKGVFDSLYMFYNSKTSTTAGGMMAWRVTCDGIYNNDNNNAGSASDGDLDVAFGLVVASWQWGGRYLDSAKVVINRCKRLIVKCATDTVLAVAGGYNGGVWGGNCNNYTDISYYSPAFFKAFAEVTSDTIWSKLANDTYVHLARNAHPTTGLVSGWQNASTGAAMLGSGGTQNDSSYNHDASRVPWRIALDYLWNGEPRAKAWAAKITNWAYGYGINNLKEGHNRNGTAVSGTSAGFAFMGAWAVGAMANDSTPVRNAFESAVANMDGSYWYSRSTGNMYWLTLTGNMWNEDLLGGEGFRLSSSADGGGAITRSPNKTKYANGETVTLTAVPNTGWDFVKWTGDVAPGDTGKLSITVTMSAAKSVTAKFQLSANGMNLVKNGDFSEGSDGLKDWTLNKWAQSQATAAVANNAVTINITKLPDPSDNDNTVKVYNLQLVQASLPLLKGNTYVLSFVASASAPRVIGVMCQKATNPWTGYFGEDSVRLTAQKDTFEYVFEMTADDDDEARIGFNLGQSMASVTISNVSVKFQAADPVDPPTPPEDSSNVSVRAGVAYGKNIAMRVTAGRSALNVKFNAGSNGVAELRLYNIKGKLLDKVKLQTVSGKVCKHAFNAAKLPSGFYVVGLSNGKISEHARVFVSK